MMLRMVVFLVVWTSAVKADLTIGTDFVFAFPCFDPTSIPSLIIVNSNTNQASLTISSSVAGFAIMQRTVASNSALQINFTDTSIVQGMRVCCVSGDNGPTRQGFRVRSSAPVALYVFIAQDDGSSANPFLILPITMLDSQYVRLAKSPNQPFTSIAVASEDGTIFAVAGDQSQYSLNRLDVFCHSSFVNGYVYQETANVPFAYFGTSADQSTIMILPYNSVSSTYSLIPPELSSHPFNAQIIAFESGTTASINGGNSVDVNVLHNGPPLIVSSSGNAITVNASKPVQFYRITPSYEYSYAPEYFLSSNLQFALLKYNNYPPNVTIIVPLQSVGNILLDGQAIPALQYLRIPNSSYYYYTQRIMGNTNPSMFQLHSISTRSSDDRYMVDVFYRGAFQKYPIAMNLPFGG